MSNKSNAASYFLVIWHGDKAPSITETLEAGDATEAYMAVNLAPGQSVTLFKSMQEGDKGHVSCATRRHGEYPSTRPAHSPAMQAALADVADMGRVLPLIREAEHAINQVKMFGYTPKGGGRADSYELAAKLGAFLRAVPQANERPDTLKPAAQKALGELTDAAIDLEGEREAEIAGIRIRLHDALEAGKVFVGSCTFAFELLQAGAENLLLNETWDALQDEIDQAKNNMAYAALDAACKVIQDELGVTTGDTAGIFFSDDFVRQLFYRYINAEIGA